MALEQIKEWNDCTSWQEIVELATNPSARIVVVCKYMHVLQSIAHVCYRLGGNCTYTSPDHVLRFANGAEIRFVLVCNVCAWRLRGTRRLDVAYLVDSFTWQLREQDIVRCELAPLFRRREDPSKPLF